jgi:hypothetical protein
VQTNVSFNQNKKEFRLLVTKTFTNLIQLKKENKQADFNALVLNIMPEIRKYINGRLNTAIKKKAFSSWKV